jgi:hypothetical protein
MVTGWVDLIKSARGRHKKEFVSVDARNDMKKDTTRAYEMLSRGSSAVVTPITDTTVAAAVAAASSVADVGFPQRLRATAL